MDRVTPATRSRIMARIGSKNTAPELAVRSYLHAVGLRYNLHVSSLPGTPDMVFPCLSACVFVHGCFWHGCRRCKDGKRAVQSNRGYWIPKIRRNRRRDKLATRALRRSGWRVFVIWECETRNPSKLFKLARSLRSRRCPA